MAGDYAWAEDEVLLALQQTGGNYLHLQKETQDTVGEG